MAEAYKTNYKDPGGNSRVGYIINGKTYKDKEGKERIEQGSTVETADGYYTLTSMGGIKRESYDRAAERAKENIDGMKEESRRAAEKLYNAKAEELKNQKRKIGDDYNKQAKKEYIRSMEAQKNINQLLKAQGINGGMSESSLLANQLAHEDAVNDLRYYRDNRMADIDSQLLALRNETDYNIALENSKYDSMYLEYADKYLEREYEQMQKEQELAADNYHRNRAYDRNVYESDRDYNRGVYESDRDYETENKRFDENMAWDREKEAIRSKQYYDKLDWEKEAFEKDYALDERELEHKIKNDDRDYALNVQKASKSSKSTSSKSYKSDNSQYKTQLEDAKLRASFGDFSGYKNLYGWDAKTEKEAEKYFKYKQK